MTIDELLVAALGPLVDGRVYPNTFPQPPALPVWPAICYSISPQPDADIAGSSADESTDALVDVDLVAPSYGEVRALCAQVIEALGATLPPFIHQTEHTEFLAPTKTHRVALQFLFQPSSESA